MELAGKYMMQGLDPRSILMQEDPSIAFAQGKSEFSTANLSPSRLLLAAHPLFAFNAQGLGFSPAEE